MKQFKISLFAIVFFSLVLPLSLGAVADRNVIEHWGFDSDNYLTGEANGIQLMPHGDPTNITGKVGDQAIHCDGDGDYLVENGDSDLWHSITSEMTLNLLIKTTETNRAGVIFKTENQNPQTAGGFMYEMRSTGTPQRWKWDVGASDDTTDHTENYSEDKWIMMTVVYDNGLVLFYKNGSNIQNLTTPSGSTIDDPTKNLTLCAFYDSGSPGSLPFEGSLDSVTIFNESLSADEVLELYDSGDILDYPFTAPPAASNDTINLSNPSPADGTDFNILPISINVSGNFSFNATCKLIMRDIVNQSTPLSPGQNQFINWTFASMEEGAYNYSINCTDNTTSEETSLRTFYYDTELPALTSTFLNNSFWHLENLSGTFTATDNIILESFNLSLDGNVIHYNSSIDAATYEYTLDYNMSNLSIGKHQLFIEVKDGHTAEKLKDKDGYKVKTGFFGDYLEYDIEGSYDPTNIKIYNEESSVFDEWSAAFNYDRYQEIYKPNKKKKKQTFIIESDKIIKIIEKPGYYGGKWLIIGNHWKDFVLDDEDNYSMDIQRVNDYKVKVTLDGIKNQDQLTFKSTGDLNILNATYDFYAINFTENYKKLVFTGFAFDINLTVNFGELEFNYSDYDFEALLELNSSNHNKNYTSSLILVNASQAEFQYLFPGNFNASINDSVSHIWHFNVTNLTSGYKQTERAYQARHEIKISQCDGNNIIYPIVNFTYTDELTDDPINVTNAYQLAVYDGTYYYNQTSFFNESMNHTFCTNINPSNATYNWNAWGTITLTKSGYVTRIINIDQGSPYTFSNNPMTTIELFMIGTANSTTMTYNWLTTNFELVQGTMHVYRCLSNGSKDLVESVPVISGVAYANIQLLLQPYSYDVTIDGTTYEDTAGFSLCHTEATTEVTYYVDTSEIDLSALIGLTAIDCTMTKIGNDTVNMIWNENVEASGYVQGCILAYRRTLAGLVEVYNNCSVEADGYNRTVVVPINGNEYIVRGELRQGEYNVPCGNEVSFFVGRSAAELFSLTGLFGAFVLILGICLMYAGKATQQLIGAGIGLVAAFILALINVSWITIATFLLILILVGIVGRLSRVE